MHSTIAVSSADRGWTTSKSGHLCSCQNCSQGPPAEKARQESLLDRPSRPPPPQRPNQSRDWSELITLCSCATLLLYLCVQNYFSAFMCNTVYLHVQHRYVQQSCCSCRTLLYKTSSTNIQLIKKKRPGKIDLVIRKRKISSRFVNQPNCSLQVTEGIAKLSSDLSNTCHRLA